MAEPIETAPKDRRILGFGRFWGPDETTRHLVLQDGWATVRWNSTYSVWWVDPNEATEYDPDDCVLTHWAPLPEQPEQN